MEKFVQNSIIIVLLLLVEQTVWSQEHENFWFRTTLSIPVTKKFKTDFELQHRRQNNLESSNPFDKNLMYTFRTWVYYKKSKEVLFALSPFAYFSNYKIIQKPTNAFAKPIGEYRFTASVELQNQLVKKVFLVNRTAFEYRAFEGSIENTTRLRNKLGLKYELTEKYSTLIGDEILINTSGTDSANLFDQNRLFANISYQPQPSVKIDFGYLYISRLLKNNTDLIEDNNFYLHFTYTLPNHEKHS